MEEPNEAPLIPKRGISKRSNTIVAHNATADAKEKYCGNPRPVRSSAKILLILKKNIPGSSSLSAITDDKNMDVKNKGMRKSDTINRKMHETSVAKTTLRQTNGVKSSSTFSSTEAIFANNTCPIEVGRYQIV